MVKVRMNTADVAAEVKCLRRLIGMRCSNVYDLSPKTYVFKLMSSSGVTESGESEKVLLLLESGVRLHTTVYMRDKSNTPSGFTLKLRRHIRTRRLEDVRQLGYDRIILFQFGLGVNAHYVILELYAQGNILLTDSEFTVLTLLRSHRDDNKGISIMSRHRYPVELSRVFERTTREKLEATFESVAHEKKNEHLNNGENGNDSSNTSTGMPSTQKNTKSSGTNKNDSTRAKQTTLKVVLGEALGYGPALSEHIILDVGLTPSTKLNKEFKMDNNSIQVLTEAVMKFEDWLSEVISGEKVPKGYILMQHKILGKIDDAIFDEFCPLLLNQFKSRDSIEFETFDAALDEFYSKIESQRVEQQQKAKENSAVQKLDRIKSDQESRVHALKREVEECVKMAELIEYNLEDVDAAILAVRVALANGMSWADLARMVKEEKKSGNPVAGLIDKLHLERNCLTLLLSNNLDEMDDDEKTQPVDKVEVDLALSAHANARRYYEQKKRQENKQEKTITAHEKAFKAAEKKTRQQLSQEKAIATISHMRKVHWFEKFNWFISSENYLVISGHDAQQNEMIVKRYTSKGDLYVHADLHGASSTVIKNHKPESPVPPLTLNQAGCFTVCHSQAWDSKIVTSAWWVYPHQVSKTAPTGEYLTVGSFMIRGKKNFLPPHPLIMGFGILFRLDESSLGSHLNERRVRGEEEGIIDMEQTENLNEMSYSDSDSEKEVLKEKVESSGLTNLSAERLSGEEVSKVVNGLNISEISSNSQDTFDETTSVVNYVRHDEVYDDKTSNTVAQDLEDLIEISLGSHLNERRVRAEEEGIIDMEQAENSKEISYSDSDSEKEILKEKVESSGLTNLSAERLSGEEVSKGANGLNISEVSSNSQDTFDETTSVVNYVRHEVYDGKTSNTVAQDLEDLIDKALELGSATASTRYYGQPSMKESASEHHHEVTKSMQRDKPYISKAERRKLKKGHKDGSEISTTEHGKKPEDHNSANQPDSETKSSKSISGKISRGQKGKLKKIKEKYADQDEEERLIRMALLAAAGKAKGVEKSENEKALPGIEAKLVTDASKICYKCKKAGHMSRDCPEHPEETGQSKADGRVDRGASEMDRVAMEEDDIHEIGDEEKEKLNDVDYLTGNPLPIDVLLYAVPVCGPYNALQSYKYRVKIIPGSLKKGKAAKTAMNLFSHMPEASSREKELMKACTDPELVAAMMGNSKVSAAGLTQMKQKQKKIKKTNKGEVR